MESYLLSVEIEWFRKRTYPNCRRTSSWVGRFQAGHTALCALGYSLGEKGVLFGESLSNIGWYASPKSMIFVSNRWTTTTFKEDRSMCTTLWLERNFRAAERWINMCILELREKDYWWRWLNYDSVGTLPMKSMRRYLRYAKCFCTLW